MCQQRKALVNSLLIQVRLITLNQIEPFLISVFSTRSNVSEKSYSSLSTGGIINRVNNQDTEYYGVPFNIRNR